MTRSEFGDQCFGDAGLAGSRERRVVDGEGFRAEPIEDIGREALLAQRGDCRLVDLVGASGDARAGRHRRERKYTRQDDGCQEQQRDDDERGRQHRKSEARGGRHGGPTGPRRRPRQCGGVTRLIGRQLGPTHRHSADDDGIAEPALRLVGGATRRGVRRLVAGPRGQQPVPHDVPIDPELRVVGHRRGEW